MATKNSTNAVRLPQSVSDFFNAFKAEGFLANFAAGNIKKQSSVPAALQQMVMYSYPALLNGRPLNKAMIVLVGQSGAGKSTTINSLFNDQICATSDCESLTRTVTEYGKELSATDEQLPSVIGVLSFVDPPGALNVDQTKDPINFATITKFRSQHPDLQPRKGLLNESFKVREIVSPNLVLMVIRAHDRMRGPDSNLRRCLKQLGKYRLLDRVCPNLLVAVTHSMSIGRKTYVEDTVRITCLIQEAVHVVLKIRDVKVVFIENMPEDYDMVRDEGCDFYSLPDGQLSHYNLIKAIEDHFDQNGDVLGRLLCGWYFDDNCPEKKSPAHILHTVEPTELTDAEVEETLHVLTSLDLNRGIECDIIPPKFNFQLLGHGYCPKTESLKNVTVYAETDTVRERLLGTLYTIPKSFQLTDQDDDKFFPITSETKELYERNRIALYGLSDDTKLVTLVDSTGRWVKGSLKTEDSDIRVVYEKRLINAKIPNPESHVTEELKRDLNLLPPTYNETNSNLFSEFFMKWGSHFVEEVPMGGYMVAECPVSAGTYNEKQGLFIVEKLKTAFKSTIILNRKGPVYRCSFDGANDIQIKRSLLAVEGGEPPQITDLAELTEVKFNDWIETITWHPVELQHSFTLCPYYALVKSEKRKALLEATSQYLDGTMLDYISPSTPTRVHRRPVYDDDDELPATRPKESKTETPDESIHENIYKPPKISRCESARNTSDDDDDELPEMKPAERKTATPDESIHENICEGPRFRRYELARKKSAAAKLEAKRLKQRRNADKDERCRFM